MEGDGFYATVRQVYRLEGSHLLVLEEDYRGDIGPGDWIEVELPEGKASRARVRDLAWGSAFRADNPPLTLILDGLEGQGPAPGAKVRTGSDEA